MGIIGYAMQIYCDFSGYSDMAIGIALIMGFRLAKNFNFPYKSRNLTDFGAAGIFRFLLGCVITCIFHLVATAKDCVGLT